MRRIAASSVAQIGKLSRLPASLRCTRLSRPLDERHPGSASNLPPTVTARRSFSHAIAEGDGISVIVPVDDPDGARSAETQRAEALLVRRDPRTIRDACRLPILWRADELADDTPEVA